MVTKKCVTQKRMWLKLAWLKRSLLKCVLTWLNGTMSRRVMVCVISTTTSMAFNEHYSTSITAMAKPIIVINIVHWWFAFTKVFLCETTSFFTIGCRQPIGNTWCALQIKQNFTSKNLWEKWSKWFLRLISTPSL